MSEGNIRPHQNIGYRVLSYTNVAWHGHTQFLSEYELPDLNILWAGLRSAGIQANTNAVLADELHLDMQLNYRRADAIV